MYPDPIALYCRPQTLAEVVALLTTHGNAARIIAGGQSLMPQLKARVVKAQALIDINRVAELDAVAVNNDSIYCGALVRMAAAARDADLCTHASALAEAAAAVGDRQVRNRGTLLGSLVFAAHWGDIAPAAAVLDARVHLLGPQGQRELPIEAFIVAPGQTALSPQEIAVGLSLPRALPNSGSVYLKHGRVQQDRATLGVAVALTRDERGHCATVKIAIGGLAQHPIVRARAAEEALLAGRLDRDSLRSAAAIAARTVATQDDELASAAFRTHLIEVYVERALELACVRSGAAV